MSIKLSSLIHGETKYIEDNLVIKMIEPHKLIKMLLNNSLIIPPFQRDVDNEKVDLIKSKINNNIKNNWLLLQGRITLGTIDLSLDNKLYVLDGQHRIRALEQIIVDQVNNNLDIYDKSIEIILIKFNNLKMMKDYFIDINTSSNIEPIYTYFNSELIQSTILKIKDWLKNNYGNCFRKTLTKSDKNKNLHINEFIRLFEPDKVKHFFDNDNLDYGDYEILLDKIILTNELVKEKLVQLQLLNKRQFYITDKDYNKCVENNFFLIFEQISCIDFILNLSDDIEIFSLYKPKTKITSKMRKDVWKKRNGNNMNGKCIICQDNIEFDNFHCGHILSENNGGSTTLDNLEPICIGCNLTMGTKNLNIYKNEYNNFKNNINYIDKLNIRINNIDEISIDL
jgi:hypothetical protein